MINEDPIRGAGIGRSRPFLKLLEQAREVAPIPRPILIRGERGTGKELLARFIHAASPRAGGSYHVVNCGAFQEELLVSHLFGHERGAFTGATRRRAGIFEKANGGTLFLDEISNLSLRAQRRLHRVVEYQTFERVGGSESMRGTFRERVATFEKGLLLSALRDAHGIQREAARALGMTYDQFRHYYKKHRLADRAD